MDSQDGRTFLSLLVTAFVVFCIAWVAVPWLQKSTLSGDESAAIETLRQIHQAQADYYGGTRMYASLAKINAPGISQDSFTLKGYEFYHSVTGSGSTWCAVAIPQLTEHATSLGTPQRRTGKVFGIDESGTVYKDVAESACYAGTLNTAGGSAVK
jgi:Tfp pilus assembly protein PilE